MCRGQRAPLRSQFFLVETGSFVVSAVYTLGKVVFELLGWNSKAVVWQMVSPPELSHWPHFYLIFGGRV